MSNFSNTENSWILSAMEPLADKSKRTGPLFVPNDTFPLGLVMIVKTDRNHVWAYDFVVSRLMTWFKILDVQPLFITKGSPWENGNCESFNGKMRYELLNGELFYSILEAKVVIKVWRQKYNTRPPHSSLRGDPPETRNLLSKPQKPCSLDEFEIR